MGQLFLTVSFDLHTNHETLSRVLDTLGIYACVRSKVEGLWRCSHVRPIKPFMGPRDWDMGVTGRLEHMRSLTCPTDKLTTFYTEKKNVIAYIYQAVIGKKRSKFDFEYFFQTNFLKITL